MPSDPDRSCAADLGGQLSVGPPVAPAMMGAVDHRSFTAERRRDAMRMRLIEAAVLCFVDKGIGGAVIGDVIRRAGVSRGSFYNHFTSYAEILDAASIQLRDEVISLTLENSEGYAQADHRLAVGALFVMQLAPNYPLLGRFLSSLSVRFISPKFDLTHLLLAQLEQGIAEGDFRFGSAQSAFDFLQGAMLQGAMRLSYGDLQGPAQQAYGRDMVKGLLCGLGIAPARAEELSHHEVPIAAPHEDSLLARCQKSHDEQKDKGQGDAAA